MSAKNYIAILSVCIGLAVASVSQAEIIYQDDFSGGTGDINGQAPDIGANNWVASATFNADGSIDNTATTGSSMTLAFTPDDGFIYTLDASISGIVGNTNWFGLGFANGQSTVVSANTRFITNTVVGTAWMLFRGDNPPGPTPAATFNVAQLGTGVLFPPTTNGGISDPQNWTALATDEGGDIDMRVVLDTTGGTGFWTATWFAKRPNDASFSEVRASTLIPMTSEANFTSVGIAVSRPDASGVDGTIEFFQLTSVVPEPSTFLLLGLGAALLVSYRRLG